MIYTIVKPFDIKKGKEICITYEEPGQPTLGNIKSLKLFVCDLCPYSGTCQLFRDPRKSNIEFGTFQDFCESLGDYYLTMYPKRGTLEKVFEDDNK